MISTHTIDDPQLESSFRQSSDSIKTCRIRYAHSTSQRRLRYSYAIRFLLPPISSLHPRAASGSNSDPLARGWGVKAIRTYRITLSVLRLSRSGLLGARTYPHIRLTKYLNMADAG